MNKQPIKVTVDKWQDAVKYLHLNDRAFDKALLKLRKKMNSRWFAVLIFGAVVGYKMTKLEDQINELHRQLQKTKERLDEQEDAIVNNLGDD